MEKFGDYFDFIVQPQKKAAVTVSLLERMREAQLRIVWPELFPETNQKMKLRNDIKLLQAHAAVGLESTQCGLAWKAICDHIGRSFKLAIAAKQFQPLFAHLLATLML